MLLGLDLSVFRPWWAKKRHSFHSWRKRRSEALSIPEAREGRGSEHGAQVCAARSCTSGIDRRSRTEPKVRPETNVERGDQSKTVPNGLCASALNWNTNCRETSPRAGATLLKAIGRVRVSFLSAKSEGQIPKKRVGCRFFNPCATPKFRSVVTDLIVWGRIDYRCTREGIRRVRASAVRRAAQVWRSSPLALLGQRCVRRQYANTWSGHDPGRYSGRGRRWSLCHTVAREIVAG